MFAGFRVASGEVRFDEAVKLGGQPDDGKVSGRDTGGALCVFACTGSNSGPLRRHRDQDEWIYLVDSELVFTVGEHQFQARSGERVFPPRQTVSAWVSATGRAARIPGRLPGCGDRHHDPQHSGSPFSQWWPSTYEGASGDRTLKMSFNAEPAFRQVAIR